MSTKSKNDPFLEFRHCNVAKNMSNFHESIGGTLDVFVDFEGFGKSTIFYKFEGAKQNYVIKKGEGPNSNCGQNVFF